MSRGSAIHDVLVHHLDTCERCRAYDPEKHRLLGKPTIKILSNLCLPGAHIYRAYLDWLTSDD